MPEPAEVVSVSSLRELVSHAHVVELLDALSNGPTSFADLRSPAGGDRRRLLAALRLAGAYGVVARSDIETCDTARPNDAVYRLTGLGNHAVKALSNFSVWTAMYDGTDGATDHS